MSLRKTCLIARTSLCLALALGAAGIQAQTAPTPGLAKSALPTIATLDVPRYMGRWYEIAKFPNWFQRKCVADTSANYRLLPDGSVEVLNQCRQKNGEMQQALGAARQIGPATSPKLQVRFAPPWLSVLPFVWGNYWVIDLDEGYELVAISEPKREYLWVLSRSPQVEPARYQALLSRLKALGLDTDKLEVTVQGGR
jgi:apolipoprotein D and lipocalin family protein